MGEFIESNAVLILIGLFILISYTSYRLGYSVGFKDCTETEVYRIIKELEESK